MQLVFTFADASGEGRRFGICHLLLEIFLMCSSALIDPSLSPVASREKVSPSTFRHARSVNLLASIGPSWVYQYDGRTI